jgi:hypothetical protein
MATPHIDVSKVAMFYGDFRFNPAPLMTYSQEALTNENGNRVADRVTLSFNGTILNTDNLESGDLSTLVVLRDAMIAALSGNNKEFRLLHGIQGVQASGTPIINNVFPRVGNVTFDESIWVDQIRYSFDLTYETNTVSGQAPVETFSDDWDFEEDAGKRVIRIGHDVSAVGIDTSVSGSINTAMQNAKTWVSARTGPGLIPSGCPGFAVSGSSDVNFERYRTEAASEIAGTYSVTEEIVMTSGAYANSSTIQFQTNDQGISTITINGDVEGMGRFDDAIDNAVSGFNNNVEPVLSGIASASYTELGGSGTLNVNRRQSFSVTRDTFDGRVGYSVSYTDDPAEDLPSGISEIQVTKNITLPIRKIVSFEIPNRVVGAIIHDVRTPINGQIAINGTIQGEPATQLTYVKQVAEDEINAIRPNVAEFNELWIQTFTKTENDKQKSFSFNVTYGFTDNLSAVPSASGEITF